MTDADYAALQQQLIAHEGLRLRPYRDTVGKITIGVGRNLTDDGISQDEAMYLLHDDLTDVLTGVSAALPWSLTQPFAVQRVLYDIAFNAGVEGLLGFHKMLAAIEAGDLPTAAQEVIHSQLAPARAQRLAQLLQGQTT